MDVQKLIILSVSLGGVCKFDPIRTNNNNAVSSFFFVGINLKKFCWQSCFLPFLIFYNNSCAVSLWLVRILVQNGLCVFATWITIATMLNLTIVLVYEASSGKAEPDLKGMLIASFIISMYSPTIQRGSCAVFTKNDKGNITRWRGEVRS